MRRIRLLPLPLVLVAVLAGCEQGENANTSIQDETGNGIRIVAGDLRVEAVTLIGGNTGSEKAAVSAVVVNTVSTPDTLEAITVDGIPAVLTPEAAAVPALGSLSVATKGDVSAEVSGLQASAGDFVPVTFRFSHSGTATQDVLIVPPVSFYKGHAPADTTPEPTPSESPTAEEGAEAH